MSNNKDWAGNDHSIYVTLGASNHSREEREEHDYYATHSKAVELLLEQEKFYNEIWEPACVDSETEYFNGQKWKKISDFEQGEKVLCFDGENGVLLEPIKYHKIPTNEELYYFNNTKIDMAISEEHKVIYEHRRKNKLCVDLAKDVFSVYEKDSNGFRGKILTSFNLNGSLEIDEWKMRLAIACNADGRTKTKIKKTYQIRIKKERKIERLKTILEKANVEYKFKYYDGYADFTFQSPYGCKEFPIEWLYLTNELKEKFLEELGYWDGSFQDGNIIYSTSKKQDADFVQLLANSIGRCSQIHYDNRRMNVNYKLTFDKDTKHALTKNKRSKLEKIKSKDGFKYCFTVDTGMLILRRNNKIFITGNCGEGHISKVLEDNGYKVHSSDLIYRDYGNPESIDFLKFETDKQLKIDIVTNPPYSYAKDFVEKSLDLIQNGCKVAMFLKLQFLEGKSRKELFKKYPPKVVYVSSARLLCAKNGEFEKYPSSAVAYAWFIWEKGFTGDPVIKWI